MAETVRLVDPMEIDRNPENPRIIFRQDELDALEKSISAQGILVPLTVFQDDDRYTILDGERRWRCAHKLGLSAVPVIVQPKPDLLTNIMMMFAIHKARSDWDPLPTAMKLQKLADVLEAREGRPPTESELAAASSLDRSGVRRYRRILALPEKYKIELMGELELPRSSQTLTVDHVLEAVKASEALRKRKIIDRKTEEALSSSLIDKFRTKILKSTVEPRQLPKLARAVDRGEVKPAEARRLVDRLIQDPAYSVDQAFKESVEQHEFHHGTEQLVERLIERLDEYELRGVGLSQTVDEALGRLANRIRKAMRNRA